MTERQFILGVADGGLLEVDILEYWQQAKALGANMQDVADRLYIHALAINDPIQRQNIDEALALIERHYNIKPLEPQQEKEENGLYLPLDLQKHKELIDTPKARKCFNVAISKGFIKQTETGYRKADSVTKALLAYFLQCVYVGNGVGFPDTPLNKLFGVTGLKQAIYRLSGNKHGNGKPKGFEKVDSMLAELTDAAD